MASREEILSAFKMRAPRWIRLAGIVAYMYGLWLVGRRVARWLSDTYLSPESLFDQEWWDFWPWLVLPVVWLIGFVPIRLLGYARKKRPQSVVGRFANRVDIGW